MVKKRLLQGSSLSRATTLTPDHSTALPDLCLMTTYSQYSEGFYRHNHSCVMGSSLSPVVANFYSTLWHYSQPGSSALSNPARLTPVWWGLQSLNSVPSWHHVIASSSYLFICTKLSCTCTVFCCTVIVMCSVLECFERRLQMKCIIIIITIINFDMEEDERRALITFTESVLSHWFKHVNDTWVK